MSADAVVALLVGAVLHLVGGCGWLSIKERRA
jgi:hypothetical protein